MRGKLGLFFEKIIRMFNEMAGVSTALAALYAAVVLQGGKDYKSIMFVVMVLAALLLTVVVFNGYQRRIIDLLPKLKVGTEFPFWYGVSLIVATLISSITFGTIFIIAKSLS